jgi:hypothetical protein
MGVGLARWIPRSTRKLCNLKWVAGFLKLIYTTALTFSRARGGAESYPMQEKEMIKMKKVACFVVVFALLVVWSGAALAAGAEGNINLLLGKKFLDDGLWDDLDLDSQPAMGLMFDIKPSGWPIALAADFLKSEEDSHGINGETREIDLGVRWYSNPINKIVRFYAGGGLGLIKAEIEGENDEQVGVWLNGGVAFTIVQHLNLGLDLRYSKAEVELYGEDIEAGGLTTSLLIGYHF